MTSHDARNRRESPPRKPFHWSNWFHSNPRLLVLVVALVVVAGLSSAAVMPRMEDPPLTGRAGQITTLFPGADADRVESLVTDKIEEELQEIDEIKELRSSSRAGVSVISIELRDDVYDVDNVWSRVRDRLSDAQLEMPSGALDSEFKELDLKAYALIVAVRWCDDDTPVNHAMLRRLSEELEDNLRASPGTEKVERFGDVDEEILVELRPYELASRSLTIQHVAAQLSASDAKGSAGQMRGDQGDLLVDVDSDLDSLARIRSTPVQFGANGAVTRLADIASVTKTIADPPASMAMVGGRRAIALGAFVRPEIRIDTWREGVEAVLQDFEANLPAAVDAKVILDQNEYVANRLHLLLGNLLLGGLAVLIVIFALMGASSALIVGTSLPLAALMVLFGLRVLDIPIHQMSITGLIIALGLLIDNAIVMVDEVGESLRHGRLPSDAVGESVRRMAAPLLGSTLTTALAFGPIALMPGPAGEFVGSIAISVILAICSSFLLAMTIVPTLAAWGIRPNGNGIWSRGFNSRRLSSGYRWTLIAVSCRHWLGIAIGVLLPVLGYLQLSKLPEQFFPPADRDQFQVEIELPANTSQEQTMKLAERVRDRIRQRDAISDVHWFVGESAPSFYYNLIPRRKGAAHYAQGMVQLKSAENVLPLIRELQEEMDREYPDARILVRQLEQGPPFDAPVELKLYGDDMEQLRDAGEKLRGIMASTDGVLHTRSEISEVLPKVALEANEEKARLAGLDLEDISQQLQAALDGAVGGSVLETTEELPVRVRLPRQSRATLESVVALDLIPSSNPSSNASSNATSNEPGYRGVPLTAVATPTLKPQIAGIPHFNGKRINELQAYIQVGMLPAEALLKFQENWKADGYMLPSGVTFEWGGEAAKRNDAIGNLMANVGVLAVLMVATLVLSFGSFRMAGLIASVAALAVGLGFGSLWLFNFPRGFMAIVGTMGLVGIAINDAIVVLASIRENPGAKLGEPEEMTNVVAGATRHVVATSLTTMAGFAPLVASGGGFWPPMAVAIAGGVGGATLLALYYVPSAYILLMCPDCRLKLRLPRKIVRHAAAANKAVQPAASTAWRHGDAQRRNAS